MGIWSDGMIICGRQIDLYLELLDRIKDHDKISIDTEPEKGTEFIHEFLGQWLEKKFPTITIESSDPQYDCNYDDKIFYLTFKSKISKINEKFSIAEIISLFNNLDIENYKTVWEILFPDEEYKDPEVFAVAHIW